MFCILRFHSDRSDSRQGFQIWYNSSDFFTSCGGNYTATNGTLTSPLHPNTYPRLAKCTYLISVPKGSFIKLYTITMDIDCKEAGLADYIVIRDGNSEDSPVMGNFCGNSSNIPATMQTTKNHMNIW